MFSKVCLILFSIAAVSQAGTFRGTTNRESEAVADRDLQLVNAELLNAVIGTYGWEVVELLQIALANNFDPIYIGEETTIEAGEQEFDLPGPLPSCKSSATIAFEIGSLSGLSTLQVNNLEMIPGTETIDLSGLFGSGEGGATWNGTWSVNATFDNLSLETTATVRANACGFPIEIPATGTAIIRNPTLVAEFTVGGSTGQMTQLAATTEISNAEINYLDLSMEKVDFDLNGANLVPEFVFNFLDEVVVNNLVDELEPRLVAQINESLEEQLPISF